jgi:hypothetical protein
MAIRRPARHIEVFDISLMAVVTKAMGAFLVIAVLLMPYYRSDPDVGATADTARDAVNAAKKQIDDVAKRLKDSSSAAADKTALDAAQDALDTASRTIDDLAKQANALASQLAEARKAAAEAEAEANKARKLAAEAQGAIGDLEHTANVERRNARTAAGQVADLEAQGNRLNRDVRAARPAIAEAEADENRLRQFIAHLALTPRWLILSAAQGTAVQPDGSCGAGVIRVGVEATSPPPPMPGGSAAQALGKLADGVVARSGKIGGRSPGGTVASEQGVGATYDVMGTWYEGFTGVAYALATAPLAAPCPIDADIVLFDLANGTPLRRSAQATLPADGTPVPLIGIDASATPALMPRNDAVMAAWTKELPGLLDRLKQAGTLQNGTK